MARARFISVSPLEPELAAEKFRELRGISDRRVEERMFQRVVLYYHNRPSFGDIKKAKDVASSGSGRKGTTLTAPMKAYLSAIVELARGPRPPKKAGRKAKIHPAVREFAETHAHLAQPLPMIPEERQQPVVDDPILGEHRGGTIRPFFPSPEPENLPSPEEVPPAIDLVSDEEPVGPVIVISDDDEKEEKEQFVSKPKRRKVSGPPIPCVDLTGSVQDLTVPPPDRAVASEPTATEIEALDGVEDEEPSDFEWHQATVLLQSKDHDKRGPQGLTYQSLVDELLEGFPVQLEKKTPKAWYQAVRKWCKQQGLSLQKPNRRVQPDPVKLAAELEAYRRDIGDHIKTNKIPREKVKAVDELCVQFGRQMRVLHYIGAHGCPIKEATVLREHIMITGAWTASGTMDLAVVYKSQAEAVKEQPQWELIGPPPGVMWLRASSKWNNRQSYIELLRGLLGNDCQVLSEDKASVHGPGAAHFVRSMGGTTFQVPANGTSLGATPDRPECHKIFKSIIDKESLMRGLRKHLAENFESPDFTGGFNAKTREVISEILVEARRKMNEEHSSPIRKAFDGTLWPDKEPHSELKRFLDANKNRDDQPVAQPDNSETFPCSKDCGVVYKSKRSLKKHEEGFCWYRRPRMFQPVEEATPEKLNKGFVADQVAEAEFPVGNGETTTLSSDNYRHYNYFVPTFQILTIALTNISIIKNVLFHSEQTVHPLYLCWCNRKQLRAGLRNPDGAYVVEWLPPNSLESADQSRKQDRLAKRLVNLRLSCS